MDYRRFHDLAFAEASLAQLVDIGGRRRIRIRDDLARSRRQMAGELGRAPRAMVWPYGRYSGPALDIVRQLVGGLPMQMPASIDILQDPALRDRFERWWKTPSIDALPRLKLYKLAWDLVGSEFAGRHQLYEKFYAGNSIVVRNQNDREAPWERFHGIVDGLLRERDERARRVAVVPGCRERTCTDEQCPHAERDTDRDALLLGAVHADRQAGERRRAHEGVQHLTVQHPAAVVDTEHSLDDPLGLVVAGGGEVLDERLTAEVFAELARHDDGGTDRERHHAGDEGRLAAVRERKGHAGTHGRAVHGRHHFRQDFDGGLPMIDLAATVIRHVNHIGADFHRAFGVFRRGDAFQNQRQFGVLLDPRAIVPSQTCLMARIARIGALQVLIDDVPLSAAVVCAIHRHANCAVTGGLRTVKKAAHPRTVTAHIQLKQQRMINAFGNFLNAGFGRRADERRGARRQCPARHRHRARRPEPVRSRNRWARPHEGPRPRG